MYIFLAYCCRRELTRLSDINCVNSLCTILVNYIAYIVSVMYGVDDIVVICHPKTTYITRLYIREVTFALSHKPTVIPD